jgi:hypothetical protein
LGGVFGLLHCGAGWVSLAVPVTCLGIVGAEAAKFTKAGEAAAVQLIHEIIQAEFNAPGQVQPSLTSGHCHLGGIDIWAEDAALQYCMETKIFEPGVLRWNGYPGYPGFHQRNISIAQTCDVLHNITVDQLPKGFSGMTFTHCYHCRKHGVDGYDHVKSGGCWTMWKAKELGKEIFPHIIKNFP